MRAWGLAMILAGCSGKATLPSQPLEGRLSFFDDGRAIRALPVAELPTVADLRIVVTEDPYYKTTKRFIAVPLAPVLRAGFGEIDLREREVILAASDGYTVPMAGQTLLDPRLFVALEDADARGWLPIGPRQADPAPLYLVWEGPGLTNTATHPRPWSLVSIELVSLAGRYDRTTPAGGLPAGTAGARGHALFLQRCIRCHAMNQQGGRVGPELNVPRNILSYRPAEQVRQFIHDPLAFRYSAMPANPDLKAADLDDLIAYMKVMADHQHDPNRIAR